MSTPDRRRRLRLHSTKSRPHSIPIYGKRTSITAGKSEITSEEI